MRVRLNASILLLVAWYALAAHAAHATEPRAVPEFLSRVTDLTGTLSKDEIAQLETEVGNFERRKGSQLALLIVPTTAPETIEEYSMRVAEMWRIGRKGVDDGVLLTIAKNDRTLRIEVGYGLEGVLNDATARRIIDEWMAPRLQENNFSGAAQDGLRQIMRVIDSETLAAPPAATDGHGMSPDVFPFYFLLVIAVVFAGIAVRKRFGRAPTGLACSLIVGGVTWCVTDSFEATGGMMFIVLFGVALADGKGGAGSSGSRSSGSSSGNGGSFGGGGSSGRW